MIPLPIDPLVPEIIQSLRAHRNLVLVAPPGAGKTTRVAPALVQANLLHADHPALILLQPRRVAARASAHRIADEQGWSLGEEVGYQIRFERRVGPRTRIRVATEGILNRQLIADPFLEGVGVVILDEFHERSIHTDLALALLREAQETVRDDLIVIVMSATMDTGPVARFLGGCPVLRAEGRAFPVELVYRPTPRPASPEAVESVLDEVLKTTKDPGDTLVFLPGVEEIRRVGQRLEPRSERDGFVVLPLHGSLPGEEQDRALRPCDRPKVVLATNVAETSLTIDGIRTVIDSGLARIASVDPERGLDRLELRRISRASAAQRAGRAGRTGPGRCFRLWSEREQRGLPEAELPEIQRVDLCSTVLALHAWGVSTPAQFGWFEPPTEDRLAAAERVLRMLGGVGGVEGRITPLGHQLLQVPAHPRIARLLLAASEGGFARAGAALAALLSEKDILLVREDRRAGGTSRARVRGQSDLLVRLDLLAEAEQARFSPRIRSLGIDPGGARRVARARDELLRITQRRHSATPQREPDEQSLLRAILLAYPDRVVRRRGNEATGLMVGGRGVRLNPESVVRDAEYFLALDPREERRAGSGVREARVGIASAIHPAWLEEFFPGEIRQNRSARFDDERQKVVGVSTLLYRDLPLREDRNAPVDPVDGARIFAEALRTRASALIQRDETASAWLARLSFLERALPESGLPAFDEEALVKSWIDAAAGQFSLTELRGPAFISSLKARLTHAQNRLLDEQAPEFLIVPSGSRVRVVYEAGCPPVLAVRLQELFGWTDTPRVACARVPVLLHLLGPNFRPVQVTDDLRSFWTTTYFQVRKDLRARYPKHSWPEDPLTARPEAKGSRRAPR